MSEAQGGGERSFAPSEKRLRDATLKGDVLRSGELGAAVALLVGGGWLTLAGPWLFATLEAGLRAGLRWDRAALDGFSPGRLLMELLLPALLPIVVLGAGVTLAALGAQLSLGRGRFVAANLAAKPSRLSPLAGVRRMLGPNGWIEAGKGLLKVAVLGTIAWGWGRGRIEELTVLGRGGLAAQLGYGWAALTSLLFALAAGLVGIALVDVPVQWLRRLMRLKMTRQELRDESKEAEGSPERRAAMRQRQRQLAMGSVGRAMREAQFVIANPTHVAVAIAYDPAKAPAPVVVAKGRGDKAAAMRELAAELALPVLTYPGLARSVYYTTRERQMIREELYAAVAGVLAFVLSLKRGERPAAPSVDVPVELRFDGDGRRDPAAGA
ncbi:MAG: EscU/YscU/HrcU family type III secretion system export apparatus switch protein [Novosphingobium sp.]